MKITKVDRDSIGSDLGLQPGDIVRSINGARIKDILDFKYYVTDEIIELEIERDGQRTIFEIEKDPDDGLGLEFEPIKVRMCGNDCPFCFVDQNPKGMRQTMYFRDEDYRLSFLAGHFVTLTNISKRDLDKIVTQRLSPLYISIHAIDPEVRQFLLGIKRDDRLLKKLDFLTSHGIELHTQIVLCPGVNDGKVLEHTVSTLADYFPQIRSVAVVPLGLTKHREGLTPLTPVTPDYAKTFLDHVDELGRNYLQKIGKYFIYASDEFFILAGREIPGRDRYDAFEQLENGVGMVRTLFDNFQELEKTLPERLPGKTQFTFVTGMLMKDLLAGRIVARLNEIDNFDVRMVPVKNRFYGETIRITGLLTGQDIYHELQGRELGDCVWLPASCVNEKDIFLDDWRVDELSSRLGTPVRVARGSFEQIINEATQEKEFA